MKQWHPVFTKMLRVQVEALCEVQVNMPVGDAPREADIVLVRRRTPEGSLPFHGLWRDLTTWNILEFKGPTVSARLRDLDRLVELGLGIDRRRNEERSRQRLQLVPPREVSFWYLANHLGSRFLRGADRHLGRLEPWGNGVWRSTVLGRLIFLVSSVDLPVEPDSLPLLIVGKLPPVTEKAVAHLVGEQPALWQQYGQWLVTLHPDILEEVEAMAKTAKREFKIDLNPAIELMGMEEVIRQVGLERVIEHCGPEKVIKQIGLDRLLASLTPAERRELKRRLQ
jgi:hypothetical protein